METQAIAELPLVVIVGPTASGKTALALELAEKFDGEIICADSRTIYKGMDIGTAKPTREERKKVPHWGLDLIEPGERFTAADFKRYATEKIKDIRGRHHIPFLVGGSGLYVDSIVFDYGFAGEPDLMLRRHLEHLSLQALHSYCEENNVPLPENKDNKRYVIRAIERKNISAKRREQPISNIIIVGITTYKDVLRQRIKERSEQLFENGVVEEATLLGKKYGWKSEAMTGNIYPLVRSYLLGEQSLKATKDKCTTIDWQLAKRQLTWLRRNPYIRWLSLDEAYGYLSQQLAKR